MKAKENNRYARCFYCLLALLFCLLMAGCGVYQSVAENDKTGGYSGLAMTNPLTTIGGKFQFYQGKTVEPRKKASEILETSAQPVKENP